MTLGVILLTFKVLFAIACLVLCKKVKPHPHMMTRVSKFGKKRVMKDKIHALNNNETLD